MGKHALLSASSSHRWLACPPSARLCESYEDKGSEYAQQGTDAHSLCEYKLQKAVGIEANDPTEHLTYYDAEMEVCAESYADYVMEQLAAAKKNCSDPIVLIEQRLDYSRFGIVNKSLVAPARKIKQQQHSGKVPAWRAVGDHRWCCKSDDDYSIGYI